MEYISFYPFFSAFTLRLSDLCVRVFILFSSPRPPQNSACSINVQAFIPQVVAQQGLVVLPFAARQVEGFYQRWQQRFR